MNKVQIKTIAELFGKIAPDDIRMEEVEFDGKKYKRGDKIHIPQNEKDFKDFENKLKQIFETQNQDNFTNLISEQHEHNDEEGPLQFLINNCNLNKSNLFQFTIEEIEQLLFEIDRNQGFRFIVNLNYLAFYRPYHYYPTTWGIYLDIDKLFQQGQRVFDYNVQNNCVPNLTAFDAFLIAFFKTYFHEIYHHKFEAMATKIELINRKPFYKDGFNYYYCNTFRSDFCLEEAFANVHGLEKSIDFLKENAGFSYAPKDLKKLIRKSLLEFASPGYRKAFEITDLPLIERKLTENKFIELIYKFSYFRINGVMPGELTADMWDLFTYKLDPLINTNNDVTFIARI
jgi:hypothetical protein